MKLGAACRYLYGSATDADKMRLTRLANAGVVRCVRVGERADRWYPRSELDRLLYGDPPRADRTAP